MKILGLKSSKLSDGEVVTLDLVLQHLSVHGREKFYVIMTVVAVTKQVVMLLNFSDLRTRPLVLG